MVVYVVKFNLKEFNLFYVTLFLYLRIILFLIDFLRF